MPDTDAEIIARLAEAMGWEKRNVESDRWGVGGLHWFPVNGDRSSYTHRVSRWDPLNDIRHAMEVDAMMAEKGWNLYLVRHQDYVAATYAKKGSNQREHRAPTPARAIALAADAALEEG